MTPLPAGRGLPVPPRTSVDHAPTVMTPMVPEGRVLAGRYELVSLLGSGGMATVHLARDRVLDRDVAVKVLRDQFATDPVFLARFTREALDVARLSHPGLVTVYDAGVDEGTAYLVMEVVHGRTVQQAIDLDGPLPVARAVHVAADVCAVLEVAHRAGIVHRDIKPANILLSDDGRTRVFDFGIARTEGSAGLTEVATVIGTAAYVSPEQASGERAGPRSDLYSLGCVLVAMLTGHPPFDAGSPVALLHRHVHDPHVAPSTLRRDVGPALDAAVLHLLAKEPDARPADARAARVELLASLDEAPRSTLLLPVVAPRGRRPSRRALVAVTALAACGLAVLAAVALAAAQTGEPVTAAPGRSVASTPTTATTARPSAAAPAIVVPVATSVPAALDAVRQVVAAAQAQGLVDATSAAQLLQATADTASVLDRKKGKSSVPRVQGLADLVDRLTTTGGIAPAAAVPLRSAVSQLMRLVEQQA